MAEKKRSGWPRRIWSATWGAVLGIFLGTACSSALARVVQAPWLKALLVDGAQIGIPDINASLGFFSLTFGFSFRFTLLSGFFMLLFAALLLFLHFPEDIK